MLEIGDLKLEKCKAVTAQGLGLHRAVLLLEERNLSNDRCGSPIDPRVPQNEIKQRATADTKG